MSNSMIGDVGFGTQIRKSPYFDATVRWGAQGFSVYNHMYIPRDLILFKIFGIWLMGQSCVMLPLSDRLKLQDLMLPNSFSC